MHRRLVISDLHFGHSNLAINLRGFSTVEEHDEHIIDIWNKNVTKRDTVYILGDITMEKTSPYKLLDRLVGIKKVVLGNHDMPQHVPELLKHVNSVASYIKIKNLILTHVPIHENQLNENLNIHGHVHMKTLDDPRYMNVCCEVVNYIPQDLEQYYGIKY